MHILFELSNYRACSVVICSTIRKLPSKQTLVSCYSHPLAPFTLHSSTFFAFTTSSLVASVAPTFASSFAATRYSSKYPGTSPTHYTALPPAPQKSDKQAQPPSTPAP